MAAASGGTTGNRARGREAAAGFAAGPRPARSCRRTARRRSDRRGGRGTRGAGSASAPGPELELAAAVDRDPALLAEVVEGEELANGAEARRLRVHAARREGQRVDVRGGVEGGVPGDPVAVRLEHRPGLVVQLRILDPDVGQALRDEPVEPLARRRCRPSRPRRAPSGRRRRRARSRAAPRRTARPTSRQRRACSEARGRAGATRARAGPERTNVTGRASRPTASASERPFWRSARSRAALSSAQVRKPGSSPSESENEASVHSPARPGGGPFACEGELELLLVRDVLADAFLAAPAELDDRRSAHEATEVDVERRELGALDDERKVGDPVEERHRRNLTGAASAEEPGRRARSAQRESSWPS